MIYDAIIVGAGPAGCNTALHLVPYNLNVALIEKETFPRFKPCGGALPAFAARYVPVDILRLAVNRGRILKVLCREMDTIVKTFSGSESPILVNREDFDNFLFREVKKRAGDILRIMEGYHVESIEEYDEGVIVKGTPNFTMQGRYLVAADGVFSGIVKKRGLLKNRKFAYSIGAEIVTDSKYYENHRNEMLIKLYCVPQGYGWVFPKDKNHFTCGVGTWGETNNLKDGFQDFLEEAFPLGVVKKVFRYSYPIPIFQGTKGIATRRILATGDAAALTDPVSGEGIRFALQSGKIAAEAIKNSFMHQRDAREGVREKYLKNIRKSIGLELKHRLSFAHLAFVASPDFFHREFVKGYFA